MLILSRSEGDAIVIDGGIRIVVLGTDRRGIRIGIEAPQGVRILRGELVAEVAEQNRRASAAGAAWLDAQPAIRPAVRSGAEPGDATASEHG